MELLNQGRIAAIVLFGGALALILGSLSLSATAHCRPAYWESGQRWDCRRPMQLSAAQTTVTSKLTTSSIRGEKNALDRGSWSFDSTLRFAAIYSISCLPFAIIATGLLCARSGTRLPPLRTAYVIWAYDWPIALNLLWSSDRGRQFAAVVLSAGSIARFFL